MESIKYQSWLANDLAPAFSQGLLDDCGEILALHSDLRALTDGWVDTARRLLQSLARVPGAHLILVTNSELAAALPKLILFGLAPFFSAESVFSSTREGKQTIFADLKRKYGGAAIYAYGDGDEEASASRTHSIPFRRVLNIADLRALLRDAELNGGLPIKFA